MTTIEKGIEVQVPAGVAYDQWTQFEDFPRFMEGVEAVHQRDARHLHWRARIGGKAEEWEAEITEQIPDKRIAWRTTSGAGNAGVVTFHRLADDRSRVMLQLTYRPESLSERAGDFLGLMKHRIDGDLRRFKEFIEQRGRPTGTWRGEVPAKEERGGS